MSDEPLTFSVRSKRKPLSEGRLSTNVEDRRGQEKAYKESEFYQSFLAERARVQAELAKDNPDPFTAVEQIEWLKRTDPDRYVVKPFLFDITDDERAELLPDVPVNVGSAERHGITEGVYDGKLPDFDVTPLGPSARQQGKTAAKKSVPIAPKERQTKDQTRAPQYALPALGGDFDDVADSESDQ
jgi:hypothetical protein